MPITAVLSCLACTECRRSFGQNVCASSYSDSCAGVAVIDHEKGLLLIVWSFNSMRPDHLFSQRFSFNRSAGRVILRLHLLARQWQKFLMYATIIGPSELQARTFHNESSSTSTESPASDRNCCTRSTSPVPANASDSTTTWAYCEMRSLNVFATCETT